MAGVPGSIDTDAGPPSRIPLQGFVVGLVFLMAGTFAGVFVPLTGGRGQVLAHVHLLLAGWVGTTILAAMTQFVPVWSNRALASRSLARLYIALVAVGIGGLAATFALEAFRLVFVPAAVAVAGFWLFVYVIGRTLPSPGRSLDVTETHFWLAIGFFVVATGIGATLAAGYRWRIPFDRGALVSAHVTTAVLGAVATTVIGAMYQLATMFTQTEIRGVGVAVQRYETAAFPVGVVLVAIGEPVDVPAVSAVGFLLVLTSLAGFGFVVARRLYEAETDVTGHPMLVRYVVAVVALGLWLAFTAPGFRSASSPVDGPVTAHLLLFGFVGFVVVGTLYHVVPFLIWIDEYSDLLGLEPVPMVDDLYDRRAERADLVLTLVGFVGVTAGLGLGKNAVVVGAGAVAAVGYSVFVLNLLLTIHRHRDDGVFGMVRS